VLCFWLLIGVSVLFCGFEANRGDYKLFERLDADGNGEVTREEWTEYITRTNQEKEEAGKGKGNKWLFTLIHTLQMGVNEIKLAKEAKARKKQNRIKLAGQLRQGASTAKAQAVTAELAAREGQQKVIRDRMLLASMMLVSRPSLSPPPSGCGERV